MVDGDKIRAVFIDEALPLTAGKWKPREQGCPPTRRLLIIKITVLAEGFSSLSQVY